MSCTQNTNSMNDVNQNWKLERVFRWDVTMTGNQENATNIIETVNRRHKHPEHRGKKKNAHER